MHVKDKFGSIFPKLLVDFEEFSTERLSDGAGYFGEVILKL